MTIKIAAILADLLNHFNAGLWDRKGFEVKSVSQKPSTLLMRYLIYLGGGGTS